MKPTHKIEENIDQHLINQPLHGRKPPLDYINENFLDDSNEKNLISIYKSPWGHNIILANITIIM